MWKRILVATDLTAVSRPALETATALARTSGATVFVLHADELPEPAKHWLGPLFEDDVAELRAAVDRRGRQLRDQLAEQLAALIGPAPRPPVEPILRWGRPADTIVAEADRVDAEVIIVGTQGAPLGSVAERVMMIAGRPVLVVPALNKALRAGEH